jgi:hypothetical protein
MINADNLHEAEQEALGHLAQMDLALATRLHQLVLNSDEPKEIIELTRAYQRASRCVRQTIMLRARLRQERERHLAGVRSAAAHAAAVTARFGSVFDDDDDDDAEERDIDTRTTDLQEASSRILAEASPGLPRREREDAIDRIDAWIDLEVREREDFGLQDLDEHVLELCRANDLPEDLGRTFRTLPRAPWDAVDGFTAAYAFEPAAEPASEPRSEPPRRDTG